MVKILLITTQFPFPMIGACQNDRGSGIKQLKRLGFDLKVITKIEKYQKEETVKKFSEELGIEFFPVYYKFDPNLSKIKKIKRYILRFLENPLLLDGAAWEFNDRELKHILKTELEEWRPDLVWSDYTYTWPLFGLIKEYKKPILLRSLNFEPTHFLEENKYNLFNYLRFLPKFFSEMMAIKKSDIVFAITPKEAKIYKRLGSKRVENLPLRGLPDLLAERREIKNKEKLNVFFMGSSYNVFHMRAALEFILKEIAPTVEKTIPGKFLFNIFGGKFPKEYNQYLKNEKIIYRGYAPDLKSALEEMDIALVPSLYGAGMQQKIFEPLCRGIPTITSLRGIGGYPFENGRDVLLASTKKEFVDSIIKLQDLSLREKLSREALNTCHQLFSREKLDSLVLSAINNLLAKN